MIVGVFSTEQGWREIEKDIFDNSYKKLELIVLEDVEIIVKNKLIELFDKYQISEFHSVTIKIV